MSSLRTRRSLSTSKNDEKWRTETSVSKLKITLRTRVQAFFSYEPQRKLHDSAYRRWKVLLDTKTHTWELRELIDITKNLPLRTVKIASDHIAYKDRFKFLFPFSPEMEGPGFESSPSPGTASTPSLSERNTPTTSHATSVTLSTGVNTPTSVDLLAGSQTSRASSGTHTDPKRTLSFSDVQETQNDTPPETEVPSTMNEILTDEANTDFNAVFQERFEDKFKEHFTKEMDLYSDMIDKRVEHVTNTLLDKFVNTKIHSLIQTKVNAANDVAQTSNLQKLVQDHIDTKIGSTVENLIQAKLEDITREFTDKIVKTDIQPRVKSSLDLAEKELLDVKRDCLINVRAESTRVTDIVDGFKSTLSALLTSTKQDLQESSESAFLLLSKDTTENLELIASEAKEALINFSEVSTDRIKTFKRDVDHDTRTALADLKSTYQEQLEQMKSTYQNQLQQMKSWFGTHALQQTRESTVAGFAKGDEVWYTRDDNLHEYVEILAVHKNLGDEDYYTIELPNGHRKQTVLSRLHYILPKPKDEPPDNNIKPPAAPKPAVASRWANTVDTASILQPSHRVTQPSQSSVPSQHQNPYTVRRTPAKDSSQSLVNHEPSPVQTRDFHKYFKAKLESNDNVLTFYQQLHSQGRNYNILLIDLKDIQPDVDLCPSHVPPVARTTMKIALYQKFQDPDCLSPEYTEGRNFVETFGGTSDGYSVLYQMIRLVHPHLIKGRTLYNLPSYSNIGDLFKYSNMMRNYILVQEIKNRYFTEKEKSEMFLHNIDDPKLSSGRAKALSELDIATMDGGTDVKVSNLRMDNLAITVLQYNDSLEVSEQHSFTGTVRSLQSRPQNRQRGQSSGNKSSQQHTRINTPRSKYVAIQCNGCGMWGHPVSQCRHVPKIAIAMDYIKSKPRHVDKLVTEFKRVNNKVTKKGTIRFLLNDDGDPESYLQENDIDIPMEDVPDEPQE